MNMKEQVTKIVDGLKTTATKTIETLSSLEHNIIDISQKIKAQLKKADDAKNPEIKPSNDNSGVKGNDPIIASTTNQATGSTPPAESQTAPVPPTSPTTVNPTPNDAEAPKSEDTKQN